MDIDRPAQLLASCLVHASSVTQALKDCEHQMNAMTALSDVTGPNVEASMSGTLPKANSARFETQRAKAIPNLKVGPFSLSDVAKTLAAAVIDGQSVGSVSKGPVQISIMPLIEMLHASINTLALQARDNIDLRDALALQDVQQEKFQREAVRKYIRHKAQVAELAVQKSKNEIALGAQTAIKLKINNDMLKTDSAATEGSPAASADMSIRAELLDLARELIIKPKETVNLLNVASKQRATHILALGQIESNDPMRVHFENCLHYAKSLIGIPHSSPDLAISV